MAVPQCPGCKLPVYPNEASIYINAAPHAASGGMLVLWHSGCSPSAIRAAMTAPPSATVERVANRIVRDVAELPDRTSPDDQPDMMLVTAAELHSIVLSALAALPRAPEAQRLGEAVEAWMRDSIDIEELHPKWKQQLTAALTAALAAPPVEGREIKRVCHPSDRECIWPDCGSKCDGSPPVDPVKQIYDEADAAERAWSDYSDGASSLPSPEHDAFLAGYAARPDSPPVVAGWVLVPKEPTEAMLLHGQKAWRRTPGPINGLLAAYRAMLAARRAAED